MGLKQKLMHYSWDLAYGEFKDSILENGLNGVKLNYVKNPFPNKWFADPFILEEDSTSIQFLVEEFDSNVGRGRIARIKVDKTSNKIVDCSIILEADTHLSFPAIYKIDKEIYVHPENFASGASFVYRYDRELDKLVDKTMLSNDPLTDAVIKRESDGYHMYATCSPTPNGCILIEYLSHNMFGPYNKHQEHMYPNNTARMAGMFIGDIRPAQDCNGEYGKAVIIYRDKKELCRIKPIHWQYSGIHTLNTLDRSFVIDMKKYDYPIIHKIVKLLKAK